MKVSSPFIQRFHLDPKHMLLSARNVQVVSEMFDALDIHGTSRLDDIQFLAYLQSCTDLSEKQIYLLFDTFDVDRSGSIEFDEFYLLFCMLVAIKDGEQKQFLYKHSATCFELLDEDGSRQLSAEEFQKLGFLFGFSGRTIKSIIDDFDVSGDKELDSAEFRMFTLAAIEREQEQKNKKGGCMLQ
eukprot:EC716455.1.p1 GENE.EC716455.1~~EC716455.1.p1  ORF type:complete len:185 (+),score=17.93 EC716455.1:52-606(+)